jgi:hypothetical protein
MTMSRQHTVLLLLLLFTAAPEVLARTRGHRRRVSRTTDNLFYRNAIIDGAPPPPLALEEPATGKAGDKIYSFYVTHLPGKAGKASSDDGIGSGKAGFGDDGDDDDDDDGMGKGKGKNKVPSISPGPSISPQPTLSDHPSMYPTQTAQPTPPEPSSVPTETPTDAPTAPTSSPTRSPSKQPTPAPTIPVGARECADPSIRGCSICGEGLCVTDDDAIFAFPGQPAVGCRDLELAGFGGAVPLDQCTLLPDLVAEDCGCHSFIPAPTAAPEPTPPPPPSFPCPDVPETGCSVCGEGQCVTNPDAIFDFPEQPIVPCGVLEIAGFNGLVPLEQCPLLVNLIGPICECGDSVPGTMPPSMSPSMTAAPSAAPPTAILKIGVDCDAIADGTATTEAPKVDFRMNVEMTISNDFEFDEIAAVLINLLQTRVAPKVAGCPDKIVAAGGRWLQLARWLQENTEDATVVNVLFDQMEAVEGGKLRVVNVLLSFHLDFTLTDAISTASCETEVAGASCIPTSTGVDIFYDGDDTTGFQQRLEDALEEARVEGLFAGVEGLEGVGTFTVTGDDVDDGISGVITEQTNEDDDSLAAGAIIAIAIGGVAMTGLLLIFFVGRRRSRKDDGTKHVIMNDDDSHLLDGTVLGSDFQASPRKVRVVGEDDSDASSVWTGYTTDDGAQGGAILNDLNDFEKDLGFEMGLDGKAHTMDVHMCASATCQICRAKRLRPTFLRTGQAPPLPERLPANALRNYVARDTVEL